MSLIRSHRHTSLPALVRHPASLWHPDRHRPQVSATTKGDRYGRLGRPFKLVQLTFYSHTEPNCGDATAALRVTVTDRTASSYPMHQRHLNNMVEDGIVVARSAASLDNLDAILCAIESTWGIPSLRTVIETHKAALKNEVPGATHCDGSLRALVRRVWRG
jgi:hypothetical protein